MSESKRVLSGSLTKGSSASQETEMIPFYQGINVSDVRRISDRLSPHMRSGDTFGIFKGGTRMRDAQFDDTITLNNELTDLREDDDRFEQRLVFDMEKANFGVAPTIPMGEPFADLIDFDPVVYLQDEGTFMYPSSLWNLGELPKHEFDGIAEVFDKRKNILGLVDFRYEGRTSRGSLTGGASERPWGSKEIVDSWIITDNEDKPFLDAPQHYLIPGVESLPSTKLISQALREYFWLETFTMNGGTYSSAANLQLWAQPDVTSPQDLSGKEVPLTNASGNLTAATAVLGSATWPAFEDNAGGGDSQLQLATATYWNGVIGDKGGGTSFPRNLIQNTFSIWVRQSLSDHSSYSSGTIWAFGGTSASSSKGLTIGYGSYTPAGPIDPTVKYGGHISTHRRFGVYVYDKGETYADSWYTEDWNWLGDGEWHNIVVVVEVDNRDSSGVPAGWTSTAYGSPTTNVTMYLDGAKIDTYLSYPNFSNADVEAGFGSSSHFQLNPAGRARVGSSYSGGGGKFFGQFTLPAIWDTVLGAGEVAALYAATRQPHPRTAQTEVPAEYPPRLKSLAYQGFQDITQASDVSIIEADYHDRVYFSLTSHNNSDMRNALRLLNSSSCNNITDPLKKQASTGLCDSRAGSITFGDVYVTGEYE
tara:strand:+ start:2470 stop:4410 length:1941 start_codon:yes stop_codon:yes gene_type:complete